MASSRKKTVTFQDKEEEDSDEDNHNFYEEPMLEDLDERDLFRHVDELGLSLADHFVNENTEDGLSLSDWKDCEADHVYATVGEGSASVFESFCEELEFIGMAFRAEFNTVHPSYARLSTSSLDPRARSTVCLRTMSRLITRCSSSL
jgi:hypothetical protein